MQELKVGEPKTLNNKHRAMMLELIAGAKISEVARMFGYTPNRVAIVSRSPRFKEEMEKITSRVQDKFVAHTAEDTYVGEARKMMIGEVKSSIERIVDLRDNAESESVALNASSEILDRVGLNKIEKVRVDGAMEISAALSFALSLAPKQAVSKT